MRFKIAFTEESEQDFLNLPNNIKPLIKRAICERLETEPLSYGKPLRHSLKGHRRLRVSDYRIIYRVQEKEIMVVIIKIDNRRDVYSM